MHTVSLPTKRPFSWKVLFVVWAFVIPASLAGIPFGLTLQSAALEAADLPMPAWAAVLINVLVNALLCCVLGGVGLFLAGRIGLGLPFIEGWLKKEPVWKQHRRAFAVAIVVGVVVGFAILGLAGWVFGPPMQAMIEEFDITLPEGAVPPAWQGFLVSISAGITEEVFFRLFGLTLLAWLGSLVSRDGEGRPSLAALWVANLLFAAVFGLAHLPATGAIGLPMNALIITRAVVLNGIGGLAFGWLYWTRGLESAAVAHFSTDIVLHVLLPLATGAETPLISIGVFFIGLWCLAAVVWLLWRNPAGRDAGQEEAV